MQRYRSIDVNSHGNQGSPASRYGSSKIMPNGGAVTEMRQNRVLSNYSALNLKKAGSLFDKKLEGNFMKVSTIFEKR